MELGLYIWSCKIKLGLLVVELNIELSILILLGNVLVEIRMNFRWFKYRRD